MKKSPFRKGSLWSTTFVVLWLTFVSEVGASVQPSLYYSYQRCQLLVQATCTEVGASNCVWRVEMVRRNLLNTPIGKGDRFETELDPMRMWPPQIHEANWLLLRTPSSLPGRYLVLTYYPGGPKPSAPLELTEFFSLLEMDKPLEQVAAAEAWIRDRGAVFRSDAASLLIDQFRSAAPRVSRAAVQACLRLMDLPDPHRANCGVYAFMDCKDSRATPGLAKWARSGEPGISVNAIAALSHQNTRDSTKVLLELTQHPRSETRRLAVHYLLSRSRRDPTVVAAARKAAKDPDPVVRRTALEGLAFYAGDAEAAETLWDWSLQVLEGDSPASERSDAAWSLQKHRGKPHPEAIERMLKVVAGERPSTDLRSVLYPLLVAIAKQVRALPRPADQREALTPYREDLDRIAREHLGIDTSVSEVAGNLLRLCGRGEGVRDN